MVLDNYWNVADPDALGCWQYATQTTHAWDKGWGREVDSQTKNKKRMQREADASGTDAADWQWQTK